MTIIVIAIIIFLLMLLFPLVMSMGSVKRKQSKALDINGKRVPGSPVLCAFLQRADGKKPSKL